MNSTILLFSGITLSLTAPASAMEHFDKIKHIMDIFDFDKDKNKAKFFDKSKHIDDVKALRERLDKSSIPYDEKDRQLHDFENETSYTIFTRLHNLRSKTEYHDNKTWLQEEIKDVYRSYEIYAKYVESRSNIELYKPYLIGERVQKNLDLIKDLLDNPCDYKWETIENDREGFGTPIATYDTGPKYWFTILKIKKK